MSLEKIINDRIESLRPKLLDLTKRNPLISAKFSDRSNTVVRIVDELPQQVFDTIIEETKPMRFKSLPSLEEDPKEEKSKEFQLEFKKSLIHDEIYLKQIEQFEDENSSSGDLILKAERELKDRIREKLKLPKRQNKSSLNLVEHAKAHGINLDYDLPNIDESNDDGRHDDSELQTLLLQEQLERKLNNIIAKNNSWKQETGIMVLQAAFGFSQINSERTCVDKTAL